MLISTTPTTPASRRSSTSTSSVAASSRPALRRTSAAALSSDATSECSSSSEAKDKRRRSSIFGRGRAVALLERHVSSSSSTPSSSSSSDASLWASGAFACEVYPDLPVAASWRGLLRAASGGLLDSQVDAATGDAPGAGRRRRRQREEDEKEIDPSFSSLRPAPSFVVRTVAAQVRGPSSVAARIQRAAGVGPGGEPLRGTGEEGSHSPDALLLVSGGHPARQLWRPTDSLRMLESARDLREKGLIPEHIELWGVANPLTEKPERAAVEKAAAGADVIVTQPPLSEVAWLRWWEGVQRIHSSNSSSASSAAAVPPIVGGIALPHSPGALRFWIALCGAAGVEGVEEEVAAFAAAAAAASSSPSSSPSSQRQHALSIARRTLALYDSLGDALAGIHVMPVTTQGREITRQLLEEGALRRWDSREEREIL